MNFDSFRARAAARTEESFRDQEQRQQEHGSYIWSIERENFMEEEDGSVPSSDRYQPVFLNMASRLPEDAVETEYDPRNQDGLPVGVEFQDHPEAPWDESAVDGVKPVVDADLWSQLEIASSPQTSITDATDEVNRLYSFAKDSMPEGLQMTGSALSRSMRQGDPSKGLTFEDASSDYRELENFLDEVTQKGRYWDYIKALGPAVLLNGLGTSVQVSGQPRKVHEDWSENHQEYLFGTEDRPGNLALKPLQRLPGANSPYAPEEEVETSMGRLRGWRETTSNSPVLGEEGIKRHGYPEQLGSRVDYDEAESFLKEQVGFRADQPMIFTAAIDADNLEVVDGETDHLDDGSYNVTVTGPDRDYSKSFREYVKDESLKGIVTFQDDQGEFDEVFVRTDFDFDNEEEFFEERGWKDYLYHEGTIWTHDRLRANVGVFEDRPEGNLPQETYKDTDIPEWEMSAYNQAAWKMKWPELQQKAAEVGITEDYASDLEHEIYEEGHDHPVAQEFFDKETVEILGAGAMEAGADFSEARAYMDWLEEGIHDEGPPAVRNHKTPQYVRGD